MRILLFLMFLLCPGIGNAQADGRTDGRPDRQTGKPDPETTTAPTTYIRLYQRFLSPARGNRCAMYPSCSAYGMEAFRRKPFATAMVLTADRMLRCGHDGRYYDLTYAYGYPSLVDLLPGDTVPRGLVATSGATPWAERRAPRTARDSVTDFIRYLINRQNYASALLEVERVAYFHPEQNDSALFLLRLLCYDGLDREEDGFLACRADSGRTAGHSDAILLQLAKMYHEVGNYDEALRTLLQIRAGVPELRRSVALRATAAALRAGRETLARQYLDSTADLLPADRQEANTALLDDLRRRRPRSPLLAGLLSVVPGGGYLYNRQPASAIAAFAVNALLGYAVYTSLDRRNYGVAGLMGVFAVTFYAGNFVGAVQGAHRYNKERLQNCADRFERLNAIYP